MCSKGEKEFSIPIPNLQLFTRLIQFFRRAVVTAFLLSPPRSEPYSKHRANNKLVGSGRKKGKEDSSN